MPFHRLRAVATTFGVAALIVVVDILAGFVARRELTKPRHLFSDVWLRLSFNSGVSFSIGRHWPVVATVVAIVVLVVVIALAFRARHGPPQIGFGLLVGGGVGNVLDRLISGHHQVTDYVAVGTFPAFNVADAAITIGFVILLLDALRGAPLLRSRS